MTSADSDMHQPIGLPGRRRHRIQPTTAKVTTNAAMPAKAVGSTESNRTIATTTSSSVIAPIPSASRRWARRVILSRPAATGRPSSAASSRARPAAGRPGPRRGRPRPAACG